MTRQRLWSGMCEFRLTHRSDGRMFPIDDFYLPVPECENPHIGQIFVDNVEWISSVGLLDHATARRYGESHLLAYLAAHLWPFGRYPDVSLGVNLFGWFFLHEEQFDGPIGKSADRTRGTVREFVDVVRRAQDGMRDANGPLVTYSSNSVRAYAQLLTSFNEGMSEYWIDRHARRWSKFFNSYVIESEYRGAGTWPSLDESIAMRRDSIGNLMLFDLIERFGHFEVPATARAIPEFVEMEIAVLDSTMLQNDLMSAGREAEVGDVHNGVLILQHRDGYTSDEAHHEILDRTNNRVRDFIQKAESLHGTVAYSELSLREKYDTDRFVTEMKYWLRGSLEWHLLTDRYNAPAQFYTTQDH